MTLVTTLCIRPWRHRLSSAALAVTTALGCASAAQAQAADAPQARSGPRDLFDVGRWQVEHRHTARFGEMGGSGTASAGDTFSLEDDFGLKRRSGATTLSYTRLIGAAWHFSADHVQSERESTATITRNLLLDGSTLPAGSTVQARHRFSTTTFAGGLALLQRGDTELGVRVGGGVVREHLRYDRPGVTGTASYITSDLAPLVGVFFQARPTPALQFDARADHLRIRSTHSTQLRVSLRWHLNAHLGLEAAYVRLDGRSTTEEDAYGGNDEGRYTLTGPRLGLRLAF